MSFTLKYNFAQVARESGFQLRSYKDGHLDWRLVGSVEIERILREQNLEQVDSVLDHLSEVPLGSLLETNILDTGIAKYFVLSQFAVQYLLFCRKFLEETVSDLREAHGSAQMEIATLKRSLSEANSEILHLHKKVSQIEAIHEVIYPCHLCTKNFVSNDALNLHISRKHSTDHAKHDPVRAETPATAAKERENDLNLINAIKLELEVKHLKERLNNAERKIKENNDVPSNDKSCRCDKHDNAVKNSVGIQSNLSEIKENDEVIDRNISPSYESAEQICVLQQNLQELNQWKEEQKIENAAFLADIESKFKDVTVALEISQKQQNSKVISNEIITSTSLKDFELFFNKKAEDIVNSSAAKMDEVVKKIEITSNSKLDELEKKLHKLASQTVISSAPPCELKEIYGAVAVQERVEYALVSDDNEEANASQQALIDNTFVNTNTKKTQLQNYENVESQPESSEKSSSLSNNTYVKSYSLKKECEDSSEISDGPQDDEDNADESNLCKPKNPQRHKIVRPPRVVQKPVTRKEVNKLADSRLLDLGIDTNTKSLTQTTMLHVSSELSKRRNVLKNKHSNFYATRNKIKKFVDKLCSLKMPENAGKLLKATRESETKSHPGKQEDADIFSMSDEDSEILIQSTPLNSTKSIHNVDFKQRLENILASPIKKPEDHYDGTATRQQQRSFENKPIPMPRKRVMFTQENF